MGKNKKKEKEEVTGKKDNLREREREMREEREKK